jgi:hypothetical protein
MLARASYSELESYGLDALGCFATSAGASEGENENETETTPVDTKPPKAGHDGQEARYGSAGCATEAGVIRAPGKNKDKKDDLLAGIVGDEWGGVALGTQTLRQRLVRRPGERKKKERGGGAKRKIHC